MIPESKRMMVQSRMARHLRQINFSSASEYLDLLEGPKGADERQHLISVLTTNVSSFFREIHHFDFFADAVLPGLITKAKSGGPIRIWSAGCSSGQEPYSIAMQVLSLWSEAKSYDLKILATDIDRKIVARARTGQFSASELGSLPKSYSRWIVPDRKSNMAQVHGEIRSLVSFKELNLLSDWPMRGKFDAIFCRNVVIYFDHDTQRQLWPRFRNALTDGGHLFLGHSERLGHEEAEFFESCSVTTYRKRASNAACAA